MSRTRPQQETSSASHDHVEPIYEQTSQLSTNKCIVDSKKEKKINYIRRKKEKKRQKKQQSRAHLQAIIKGIFELKMNFKDRYQQINNLLDTDLDSYRFFEFINVTIREEVEVLRRKIHSMSQNICTSFKNGQTIQPAEVIKIYQKIYTVRVATHEVEKIINCFLAKLDTDEYTNQPQTNLNLSTIKNVLESDPYNRQFEHFCRCSVLKAKGQRLQKILQQILNIFEEIKNFSDNYENEDDDDDDQDQDSTLQCNEQIHQECKEQRKKLKKIKYKKKIQKRKKQQQIDKQYKEVCEILSNFQSMMIQKKQRLSCYTDDIWLQNLKTKYRPSLSNS